MFENTLIASKKQQANTRLLMALPIALAIHVVVLAGYVVGQMWSVAEVPDPPIQVSFFQAAAMSSGTLS